MKKDDKKINLKILEGELDAINRLLKEKEATLHIITPEYAYLKIGRMSYYFHRTRDKNKNLVEVKKEEITTLKGEKKTKTIVPYDGWEMDIRDYPLAT